MLLFNIIPINLGVTAKFYESATNDFLQVGVLGLQ